MMTNGFPLRTRVGKIRSDCHSMSMDATSSLLYVIIESWIEYDVRAVNDEPKMYTLAMI